LTRPRAHSTRGGVDTAEGSRRWLQNSAAEPDRTGHTDQSGPCVAGRVGGLGCGFAVGGVGSRVGNCGLPPKLLPKGPTKLPPRLLASHVDTTAGGGLDQVCGLRVYGWALVG
jgi:hypothetical protein